MQVMRGEIAKICLVIAILTLGTVSSDGACERGRTWWDRHRGACIPCTRCDPRRLAVKYPCELHRDTICQPLYEVRIWPFNTEKDNDVSETSSDYEYYEYTDYSGEVSDELDWNIQTSTLTLAVSGCIVFFVVVVTLSFYHAKQWRVLKQTLKSGKKQLALNNNFLKRTNNNNNYLMYPQNKKTKHNKQVAGERRDMLSLKERFLKLHEITNWVLTFSILQNNCIVFLMVF